MLIKSLENIVPELVLFFFLKMSFVIGKVYLGERSLLSWESFQSHEMWHLLPKECAVKASTSGHCYWSMYPSFQNLTFVPSKFWLALPTHGTWETSTTHGGATHNSNSTRMRKASHIIWGWLRNLWDPQPDKPGNWSRPDLTETTRHKMTSGIGISYCFHVFDCWWLSMVCLGYFTDAGESAKGNEMGGLAIIEVKLGLGL